MALDKAVMALIRKYALKNAVDYSSADPDVVVNKVLSERKDLRGSIAELRTEAKKVADEINRMGKEEREKEFSSYAEEFEALEKEKEERTAKPKFVLEGAVVGDFATRFPPEPNGYIHIGNAKAAFLAQKFAEVYKGKLFLYFDDTNPEKEKQEFVNAIKYDLDWLGFKFDKEYYASDNLEKEYKLATQLIESGDAYACTCKEDTIKKNRYNRAKCEHRNKSKEESMQVLYDMLGNKYGEDEAVIRFKGDMMADNPTLRDPVILRVKKAVHYRQGDKYIVWPSYNFNTPIMDSLNGVTDAIRSKEDYEIWDDFYKLLLRKLGLRVPRMHYQARLNIDGIPTHKRVINKLIEEHAISGYDDPRLVTIAALRRRGIRPEAIKEFVLRFGMSRSSGSVSIDMLLAENRKIIDKYAKRLFFVKDPVKLKVRGIGDVHAKLRLHPNYDMGYREYDVGNVFYLNGDDARSLRVGERVRIKDLYNVEVESLDPLVGEHIGNESIDAKKLQWVSEGNYVRCKLMEISNLFIGEKLNKDSSRIVEGYAEEYVDNIKENELVQFERVGFYKLDDKKSMLFFSL